MPEKIEIDLERLEDLAARGLSQKQAAAELGVKYATLISKFQRSPELKDAWARGAARAAGATRGEPDAEMSDDDKIVLAIRSGLRTAGDIKRHTGLKNGLFMNAVERLEVEGRIKSRDEHMLAHYYLIHEDFPPLDKPADVPPAPVSAALVSSSCHAETLDRVRPELKNVTPARADEARQPELEVIGRAVVPLADRVDVGDALRGLQVERAYFDYHGASSPTMNSVLSKVESTLQEIAREASA